MCDTKCGHQPEFRHDVYICVCASALCKLLFLFCMTMHLRLVLLVELNEFVLFAVLTLI